MQEIHPTAIIGENVKLGEQVKIGCFVVIGNNVEIKENVSIKPFCEIRDGCKIGNNVSFGSRCTLAENTIVRNDVIIKYGVVATNTPNLEESERLPCELKEGSKFGANVTLMPGVTIGKNSEIGACSQVRHNVPDNEIWYGSPAKFFKKVNS